MNQRKIDSQNNINEKSKETNKQLNSKEDTPKGKLEWEVLFLISAFAFGLLLLVLKIFAII